jgi:hypothetical protein
MTVNRILRLRDEDRLCRSPAFWDIPAQMKREENDRLLHVRVWKSVKSRFGK